MAASSTGLHGLSRHCCRPLAPSLQIIRCPIACKHHLAGHRQQHVASTHIQQPQERSSSRASIIAAAGRRRRNTSSSAAAADDEDDEPNLDMDDVMFHQDDEGEDDGELPIDDDQEDEEEFEWEEDEDDEVQGEEDDDEEYEQGVDEDDGEGEDDAWDSALADFDIAQDVPLEAAAAGPSKEEQDRQKALAMVRFNEVESDAIIEVEEPPPLEEDRQKTFEEQTALLSAEDKDTLTRNLQGYAVFPLEYIDLLVSELPDGRMILSDCFIRDREDDLYQRPTVNDDVPRTPQHYQLIPWEHTNTGSFLKNIDPVVKLIKMYFVGVSDPSDISYQCDFSRVFSFDGRYGVMSKHDIVTLGNDIKEPVMRIREDGIFVEDAYRVPGVAVVAEGFAGHPEEQYENWEKEFNIREFVKMGLWPEPGDVGRAGDDEMTQGPSQGPVEEDTAAVEIEERLEELELMEEMDDMPDVPAVDMM